jgi:sec-independent protein translocase protein TatC
MAEKNNNTNEKNTGNDDMSFWGHLEALRWHLLRSFIAVLVFAILAFIGRDFVFDTIILAPKRADFITNIMLCRLAELIAVKGLCIEDLNLTIVNLEMSGQFLIHLYISIIAGIIIAIPYIIGEIWAFIRPALYPDEQKHTTGAVIVTSLLFIIGVLFSYFLIVPLTINFLGTYQVSESVTNTIALRSYISTVVSLTFALGLVFEMPIFVFFITKVGLLTPAYMRRNRKYMLVIVLLLSAIITPADVFSQIMVAFPLFGLYEVSIWVSAYAYRKHQMEEE